MTLKSQLSATQQLMEVNEFLLHYQPQVNLVTGKIIGMEALIRWQSFEKFAKNRIGVVISDEQMPGMHGIEFLQNIKMIYPDTVRIILTAFGNQGTVTEAVNKGAIYKFHCKPWEPEVLRKSAREAFKYYKSTISHCV